MGVWKRAWLYITRKRIRSILLFLILAAAELFLLAGITVRSGADTAAEDVRKSLTSGIIIQVKRMDRYDMLNITKNEKGQEVATSKTDKIFTWAELEKVLDFEGVSGYYLGRSGQILYTGLEIEKGHWAETLKEGYYGEDESEADRQMTESLLDSARLYSESLTFYEVSEGKWAPSFLNGALEITEGRNIERTDLKKAVISEGTAKKNGLKVGDMITASSFDDEVYGSVREMEIVGIYRINFNQAYSSENTFEDGIMENVAFTDMSLWEWASEEYHKRNHLLRGILLGKAAEHVGNVRIYVDDPKRLSEIRDQILAMDEVDWSFYDVTYDDTDYQAAARPLLLIRKLLTAFLVILSVGTLFILSLVLSMWVRSRKHEIGVLISVGTKKRTICLQLVLEGIIIAAAAFIFAGVLLGPVTEKTGEIVTKVFSSSADEEDYKVVFDAPTQSFEVHKEVSGPVVLQYEKSLKRTVVVLLVMMTAVVCTVLYVSIHIINQKPGDILRGR